MHSRKTTLKNTHRPVRCLKLIFGDQLDPGAAVFDEFDPNQDAVWMAEAAGEVDDPPAHQWRIVFFLSAMRHFRNDLQAAGKTVHYHTLSANSADDRGHNFSAILTEALSLLRPQRVEFVRPGDFRVRQAITATLKKSKIPFNELPDRHFLSDDTFFRKWAEGRTELRLEYFYRELRRHLSILTGSDGKPQGGSWNYDSDNRKTFGKKGPVPFLEQPATAPDEVTNEVISLVSKRFGGHPGDCRTFSLPVTADGARRWLEHFIQHQLANFGSYQDALWLGEDFLYHSRLSAFLNVKILDPREVIEAALAAYHAGQAPLNSVEGFIRQIVGWREFVRGVYWHLMPGYAGLNALGAHAEPPAFFWTGETPMVCLRDSLRNVVQHGYAHHIQRLMVIGLYAQLYGVHPYAFHRWHMAMYLDAIDWVSLPNTLGMSQFGDGGRVGSKPYCASGNYINKMSNFCTRCQYNPAKATGTDACPFTTLYWDFLDRHADILEENPRMGFQFKNLRRKPAAELAAIRQAAEKLRGLPRSYRTRSFSL